MNRIIIFSLSLFLCTTCKIRKDISHRPVSFPIKEKDGRFFFDNKLKEFSYVFEPFSLNLNDSLIVVRGVLYKDFIKSNNLGDSLLSGVSNVRVLLLKYGKNNEFKLRREFDRTNCFGGFNLYYYMKEIDASCIAFVMDSVYNVAYDLSQLANNHPFYKKQFENIKVDSTCSYK